MNSSGVRAFFGQLEAWRADERGASAAEFALWITFMVIPFLNVMDLGFYEYRTMQVRAAAQAGAQSVVNICGYNGLTPAATRCTALNSVASTIITKAVQSTSLGSNVTLTTGTTAGNLTTSPYSAPFEGWYCSGTAGHLAAATVTSGSNPWFIAGGTAGGEEGNCSADVTGNTQSPGDYAVVTVSYNYVPVFNAVSLVSILRSNSTITQTAWMRLN
jgi:hypothetical protein